MRNKRKAYLIDSNQSLHKRKRCGRSRFLHTLSRLLFLRQFSKLFKRSFLLSLFFLGCLGVTSVAIFSPYFELKKISIVRESSDIDSRQVETALKSLYGKNIVFLSHKKIYNILQKLFPAFKSVEIRELWPDALELQISTYEPAFNILNQETANFSIIAENGSVLSSGADKLLPTIKIMGYTKTIVPKQQFTNKETIKKIVTAENLLTQKLTLPLKEILFFPVANELHLISKNDMEIWLDLNLPIALQMEKLELSANRIGLYSEALKHVDLRIPDQLFWATR